MQVVGQPARDVARHFVERFVSHVIYAEYIIELPTQMELFTSVESVSFAWLI
jgi:hypothetical protein